MERETDSMKRSSMLLLTLLHLVIVTAAQGVPATNITLQKRIDTHCHYVPPFYRDILRANNITAGGLPIPAWNESAHLALNAEVGIVTSVVSVSTPGAVLTKDFPIDEARTLARQLNEYGHRLTIRFPKKFLFFATLTLPDVDGAVAEAIYALDTLKAAGVILLASTYGELLGTPRFAPLYSVLDARSATVFVHPSNSPCPQEATATQNSTDLPPFVIDFLLDTSRAAINLVYRNVTTNYPNIKFILAHSGGLLPFAATRAAGALTLLQNAPAGLPVFYNELKKFFVDLALSATATALPSTTAFFNVTHITYGSDFPFAPAQGIVANTESLLAFPLSNSQLKKIDYVNAYGLVKNLLK